MNQTSYLTKLEKLEKEKSNTMPSPTNNKNKDGTMYQIANKTMPPQGSQLLDT